MDPKREEEEFGISTMKAYLTSIKGIVKIVRLILIVVSLTIYILAQAPEPYIVITILEGISVFLFVLLYLLRLDLKFKWLFWPLLDILNSFMTTVFLMTVSVLAMVPDTTIPISVAGILGILATVFTIADAALIYRKLMFNPSGPYEKKVAHDKKRLSRLSRFSQHSQHSQQSQQSQLSQLSQQSLQSQHSPTSQPPSSPEKKEAI